MTTSMSTIRRLSLAFAVTATLAACSSGVKLNEVPVEDKAPSTVGTNSGASTGSAQSSVANVSALDPNANVAGPTGVARVVYFDYDSFVVKPEFQSLVDAHSRFLKQNTQRRVAIEGHTDERGGREYNLALGQKRAEAVRRAFNLLGVSDSQIEAVSFGEEKPASSGADESSFAQNRRAEVSYR